MKSYFGYVTSEEGQKAAAEASDSAPLPSTLAAKVKTAVDSIK